MPQKVNKIEQSTRYFLEDLISVEQAVPLLGLSKRTIQDMASRRELPVYKIKKCVRFRVSELEAWLQERKVS